MEKKLNIQSIDKNTISNKQFLWLDKVLPFFEQLCDESISPEIKRHLRETICNELRIGKRMVRVYFKRYKEGGIKAILRQTRSDKGKDRTWNPELIPKALALFEENPYRTLSRVHEFLKDDEALGESAKIISTSCLYQRMRQAGVDFGEIKNKKSPKRFCSFEALFPNALWQSDARHGIWLPHPQKPNKTKRTYLFCWMDDHSRFILYARYYFDEKLPTMEEAFRQAALRHGLPDKVYLDNGSAYVGKQFAIHLSDLDVNKIHHPPYAAWCKGKVESQMKMFKKFQREAELSGCLTLEELNSALAAWIDVEHNRKVHSSTGQTPLARYKNGLLNRPARYITDLRKFEEVFFWRFNRVVNKYGNISFYNNLYCVPDVSPRTSIEIRINPFNLEEIFVYSAGQYSMTLKAKELKRKRVPYIPEEKKESDYKTSKAAANFMTKLRKQHAKNIREEANQTSYNKIKNKGKNYD